jgi:type I restriction enzyme S subunit
MIEGVKISEIKGKGRFDATPYVSENASLVRYTNRLPSNKVGAVSFIHKVRNRDSRVYVKDPNRGLMYLSNTDMQKASYDSAQYMSKKFLSNIKEQKLLKGDIIISAVGTIGQLTLVNELLEGSVISGNILRFTPKENPGFIYAYMQSKYGQANLLNIASGSVQEFITPPKLADFNVPNLPEPKQQEIHNLITEASNLRAEANKLLSEAVEYFESIIGESKVHLGFQTGKVGSKSLNSYHKRLDSQFQLLWNDLESEEVDSIEYGKVYQYAKSIFVGGRGKRNYVEKGVAFLSSSEMMLFNPKRGCKYVSKNNPGLDSMMVSKKDILISRSGTVGNTVLVGDDLAGTAISEHALRLVIDSEKISPNYVFCFLKTKYGMKSMEASSFGSVIITLNEDLIGNINMPILDQESQDKINKLIESYLNKMDEATRKENEAIDLVEQEIETWQK